MSAPRSWCCPKRTRHARARGAGRRAGRSAHRTAPPLAPGHGRSAVFGTEPRLDLASAGQFFDRTSPRRSAHKAGVVSCVLRSWRRAPSADISARAWPRPDTRCFFIARGAHLAAIRQGRPQGRKRARRPASAEDANATDDPAEVGPVDIVLFAVKLWDTEKAAEQAKPLIGPNTRVITLQNGVDSVERIAPILGADHVVGGIAYHRDRDLRARRRSRTPANSRPCIAAASTASPTRRSTAFADAAKAATRRHQARRQTSTATAGRNSFSWSALSGMTAATRSTIGPILADPDTRAFFRKLMTRDAGGRPRQGRPLSDDFIEEPHGIRDKPRPA